MIRQKKLSSHRLTPFLLCQFFTVENPGTSTCLDVQASCQYTIQVKTIPDGFFYSGQWSAWSELLTKQRSLNAGTQAYFHNHNPRNTRLNEMFTRIFILIQGCCLLHVCLLACSSFLLYCSSPYPDMLGQFKQQTYGSTLYKILRRQTCIQYVMLTIFVLQ